MGHAWGKHKHGAHLLTLVEPPAIDALDIDTAKAHLYVDFSDDDALITAYIKAAVAFAEEKTGKALITQTWDESIACPSGKVYLSKVPVQSLASITYYDADNVQQTANLADFTLVANEDWAYVECDTWPTVYDRADALTIRYVAGFGDATTDVPSNLTLAMLLLVAQYYMQRENVSQNDMKEPPQMFTDLVNLSARSWYG